MIHCFMQINQKRVERREMIDLIIIATLFALNELAALTGVIVWVWAILHLFFW